MKMKTTACEVRSFSILFQVFLFEFLYNLFTQELPLIYDVKTLVSTLFLVILKLWKTIRFDDIYGVLAPNSPLLSGEARYEPNHSSGYDGI